MKKKTNWQLLVATTINDVDTLTVDMEKDKGKGCEGNKNQFRKKNKQKEQKPVNNSTLDDYFLRPPSLEGKRVEPVQLKVENR